MKAERCSGCVWGKQRKGKTKPFWVCSFLKDKNPQDGGVPIMFLKKCPDSARDPKTGNLL